MKTQDEYRRDDKVTVEMVRKDWERWTGLSGSRLASVEDVDDAFKGLLETAFRFMVQNSKDKSEKGEKDRGMVELMMSQAQYEHPIRQSYRVIMPLRSE